MSRLSLDNSEIDDLHLVSMRHTRTLIIEQKSVSMTSRLHLWLNGSKKFCAHVCDSLSERSASSKAITKEGNQSWHLPSLEPLLRQQSLDVMHVLD